MQLRKRDHATLEKLARLGKISAEEGIEEIKALGPPLKKIKTSQGNHTHKAIGDYTQFSTTSTFQTEHEKQLEQFYFLLKKIKETSTTTPWHLFAYLKEQSCFNYILENYKTFNQDELITIFENILLAGRKHLIIVLYENKNMLLHILKFVKETDYYQTLLTEYEGNVHISRYAKALKSIIAEIGNTTPDKLDIDKIFATHMKNYDTLIHCDEVERVLRSIPKRPILPSPGQKTASVRKRKAKSSEPKTSSSSFSSLLPPPLEKVPLFHPKTKSSDNVKIEPPEFKISTSSLAFFSSLPPLEIARLPSQTNTIKTETEEEIVKTEDIEDWIYKMG